MRGRLWLMALLGLGGCAHSPQQADIRPHIDASPLATLATSARPLVVILRDERSRKIIGRRGDALGTQAAISAPDNLADIMGRAVSDALMAQGIEVRRKAEGDLPVLRISLRDLSYESRNRLVAGFTLTVTAAVGFRTSGTAADFEQVYRSEKQQDAFPTPTAETNNALINTVLNEALQQALADPELKQALLTCRGC